VLSGNSVWGGVSIACVLMVAIYALGGISGANFNPAVSFSLGIVKSMGGNGLDWSTVFVYACLQLCGGLAAGFSYLLLFQKSFSLSPAPGFNWFQAGLCETLYTCMLCFVVLNVAAAKKNATQPNHFYGLAIGFVIIAGAYGAGAVSGGCFNPAVAFGIDASSSGIFLVQCVSYIFFELLGAALAAVLFRLVRAEDFEGEDGSLGLASKIASEFLGTFMLVLTVGLNVLGKSPAAAFSIAASLMCMIYALGDVSGAHFNPAVTVGIFVSGLCQDLTLGVAAGYIVAQLVGGVCAAFTYAAIYSSSSFPLQPGPKYGYGQVAVAEIMFTFVLCYVVLCVAVSKKTASKEMFGLAIGSCVTVGGFAIGGVSGGSLNPAVSFGISSAHLLGGGGLMSAFIYSGFEILGGAAAAGVLKVTHADAPQLLKDDKP